MKKIISLILAMVMIWISKNAGVFIIPGILIGVSFGSKLS